MSWCYVSGFQPAPHSANPLACRGTYPASLSPRICLALPTCAQLPSHGWHGVALYQVRGEDRRAVLTTKVQGVTAGVSGHGGRGGVVGFRCFENTQGTKTNGYIYVTT